jgi:hypothetical protein
MKTRPTLRIPIAVSALVLCALASLGWHDRQRLVALRAARAELVAQSAARGIQIDPAAAASRSTKRPRVDRAAEARQVAAGFMAYAREMAALGDKVQSPDAATRERIIQQMNEVTSLDGRQLVILIDEIFAAEDHEGSSRQSLIRFSLERLGRDHPEKVMAILAGKQGMIDLIRRNRSGGEPLLFDSAEKWAERDPRSAMDWFLTHHDMLDDDLTQAAQWGVICGLKITDPALAIGFAIKTGEDPKKFIPNFFSNNGKAPENRDACLAALRDWSATVKDEQEREKTLSDAIRTVALGTSFGAPDFESATRWIDGAGLSPKELGFIADRKLAYHINLKDTGRWIEWLADKLPTDEIRESTRHLFEEWTRKDVRAAGTWLANAPDSPTKHTAALAFAEKVFPHDRETAIRWALTVPPGPDRDRTLKELYDAWPKNSPADEEAARNFARTVGIAE